MRVKRIGPHRHPYERRPHLGAWPFPPLRVLLVGGERAVALLGLGLFSPFTHAWLAAAVVVEPTPKGRRPLRSARPRL